MAKSARIAVIGAGLGGLCAAIKLKQAGYENVRLFERAAEVGGTWRENTYPGCSCDTPVALYQFSFAPSVGWKNTFPSSAEVKAYAEELCDSFGLRPHLHLGEEPVSAKWNEAERHWVLTTKAGKTYEADAIVPALGQLNRPMLPEIEGRDGFAGPAFHSARWRHDVDLADKRVACIGSAASAVQLIPEVAKVAGHLTVFQRSANWIGPRLDRPITPEEIALVMTEPEVAMELGAANRKMIYENADHFFWQAFAWTEAGRAMYTRLCRDHMEKTIADPAMRAKLTPDYPVGCKRILFTDEFYPALNRPNVTLETRAIGSIAKDGVVLKDGSKVEADAIIYATGFETTGWHWSLDVTGSGGIRLNDEWKDAPEAYLGITVAGFPNMFMLYGPNTNLGHNTITFMIERQTEYLVKALDLLEAKGKKALTLTADAQARFNDKLQRDLAKTVWADPHCRSWYKTADGRVTQNWSSHTRDYAKATAEIAEADYSFA